MEKGIVVYNAATVVHRAKKMLRKKKVPVRVVQLPSDLGLSGCSYGLECETEDLSGILAYSQEQALAVKAVFRVAETKNGKVYTAYDLS